jgi:MSHA biogenesis protein MshI
MRLFQKNKKSAGWLVVYMQPGSIHVASVKRLPAARPQIELADCFSVEAATVPAVLEKKARELHAEQYDIIHLLSGDEYQMLSVEAPNVPADELKKAIRWRLKDMLDVHVDDVTIDVLDVPLDKNAVSRNHSMYAVCARNQLVEQRQRLFDDAKLPLRVIDIPEMAQRNIASLFESEGRGLAMLSFDEQGGLLTISYAGELYLSRRIDVSLRQLSAPDEESRRSAYERVTLELQRSLDHFDRQYHYITLNKLLLAPLGKTVSGLDTYLADQLYVPVEIVDLTAVMDFTAVPLLRSSEAQQKYFMALGAALRLEEAVL